MFSTSMSRLLNALGNESVLWFAQQCSLTVLQKQVGKYEEHNKLLYRRIMNEYQVLSHQFSALYTARCDHDLPPACIYTIHVKIVAARGTVKWGNRTVTVATQTCRKACKCDSEEDLFPHFINPCALCSDFLTLHCIINIPNWDHDFL